VFRHDIVRFGTLGTGPAATVDDDQALAAHFSGGTIEDNLVIRP